MKKGREGDGQVRGTRDECIEALTVGSEAHSNMT